MNDFDCPILRPDAAVRIADDCVELEIEDEIFTVSGVPASSLGHAIASMNGLLDSAALARQSSLPADSVRKLVDQLAGQGALATAGPAPRSLMPAAEFGALCRRLNEHWKQRLFAHPLWAGLAGGTLPRSVFVGWVVESMWFIEGVLDRIPMAIAHTENRAVRDIFSQHFSEEWNHFHFFTRALDTLGVTAGQRAAARPLPATRAVQHWMRASARRDPLRYAACSGFLESTGKDRLAAGEFFRQVGAWYDSAAGGAVGPMAAHVALDEQYGHGGFVDKVLAHFGDLDRERARAALQDAFGLVETLEMWSTDILRHYQSAHALPLPAMPRYRGREN